MRFEWDDSKNEENRKKHGLSFEVAIEVFDDPLYVFIFDCVVGDEQRYWAVGLIGSLAGRSGGSHLARSRRRRNCSHSLCAESFCERTAAI